MNAFTNLQNMPVMDTPEEFIQTLIQLKPNVRIYDFMLELKERFYPKINMILYEDLSQYVGREQEYCIDARMFYKYSKLCVADYEFDLKTCDKKSNIKDVLNGSDMKIDRDYLLLNVQEQHSSGSKNSNRYMLKPDSFYLLLMDIPDRYRKARQIFCKYHAFLTKVIKYYDNFQIGVAKLIEEEMMIRIRKGNTHTRLISKISNDKIDNLTKEMKQQSTKIDQLLAFGNKLVGQNENIQLTLDMTNEKLEESLDYLVRKSYHSTIDPANPAKITHIAVLAPDTDGHVGTTILVRGQRMQITKKIDEYYDTHTSIIDTTYNANDINLIENAKQRFSQLVREYVAKYNIPIIAFNEKLKEEIAEYNKEAKKFNKTKPKHLMIERQYSLEKKPRLTIADIPISFKNTLISYRANRHIAYDTVIQTIIDMNTQTQMSPVE